MMAPAHMGQGSSVTARPQPERFQLPRAAQRPRRKIEALAYVPVGHEGYLVAGGARELEVVRDHRDACSPCGACADLRGNALQDGIDCRVRRVDLGGKLLQLSVQMA